MAVVHPSPRATEAEKEIIVESGTSGEEETMKGTTAVLARAGVEPGTDTITRIETLKTTDGGVPVLAASKHIESRRKQREDAVANIWPPSPKTLARELSPKHSHKSSKRHSSKRARSSPQESSEVESSDEEDQRRRRKDKKHRSKGEKERDRYGKRRHSRSRSRDRGRQHDKSEKESDEESRKRHRSKRSETHSESRSDRERRMRSEDRG
ncbi:hypothetical protein AX17_004040 [Amanita inopinata Kibby_2008]|nr:hypothetical protein AX17_004040 [Amanita inopinata Kibby_2008]